MKMQNNPAQKNTIKEIQKKLRELEKSSRIEFQTLTKREKDILFKTVKLSEEVGELSNDILSVLSLQRKSKLDRFNKDSLYGEFADVVVSTMKLATSLKVDLERALREKIKKIEEVYSQDR